jgi:hypothetical protein
MSKKMLRILRVGETFERGDLFYRHDGPGSRLRLDAIWDHVADRGQIVPVASSDGSGWYRYVPAPCTSEETLLAARELWPDGFRYRDFTELYVAIARSRAGSHKPKNDWYCSEAHFRNGLGMTLSRLLAAQVNHGTILKFRKNLIVDGSSDWRDTYKRSPHTRYIIIAPPKKPFFGNGHYAHESEVIHLDDISPERIRAAAQLYKDQIEDDEEGDRAMSRHVVVAMQGVRR